MSMILLFFGSNVTTAASFDCNKAQSPNELLICSNEQLSALDEQLAEVYKNNLQSEITAEKNIIIKAQTNWLKQRDQMCTTDAKITVTEQSTKCLEHLYKVQIDFLPEAYMPPCEPCTSTQENLFYNFHRARVAPLSIYESIANYVVLYEAAYGQGSAIPTVNAVLQEIESVRTRIEAQCATYSMLGESGYPIFGREGRAFHEPICRKANWENYIQYLQNSVLHDIPSVQ